MSKEALCVGIITGKRDKRKTLYRCISQVTGGTCGKPAPVYDIKTGKMVCLEHVTKGDI